ncbi:hypothetical protein PF005_g18827 [Phytophthora fragariae]|nr:hypothetical protein PF003_g11621 [Phytophthora fragariae]KAE8982317.1 hypothetical protein PF011_g21666 [Phytophthora fragariae]KAE9091613.1 hypothetical protein PF010_g18123 [Phytophthora fragariae]KAE9092385.1 hypothetical protein PF007_g18533 [Phytophthora fragariae]KAE9191482.1 hypothetical protein PF005_g18827 [Phytophthora fragariae]
MAVGAKSPLGAMADCEYAEPADDTRDIANGDGCPIDEPDREIDDREKPRSSEGFFEYKDVGVGLGVETADGLEYNVVGVGACFEFDADLLP